ncbi:MAG TPA: hypothetical protein VK923_20520 [Euzebyales bacterium]|nr:hypothetical protein [Euzebyales bacterium]
MQSPTGRSEGPIPPPPPSLRQRAGARIRRLDSAGHRPTLLVAGVVFGALVTWLLVTVIGLWLQPRFTLLELGAQRLAPDVDAAQPPVEQVEHYGAFDRRYAVRFPTPDAGLPAVVAHARRLRWDVSASGLDRAVLNREGITATLSVDGPETRVQTRVAAWVRTRQRQSQVVALLLGAVLGGWSVWTQVRRRPRPVRSVDEGLAQNRQS